MSGDAIPNLRAYRRGIPDLAFFSEDLARKSVQKIKNLNPDLIIPGHDAPFTKNGYTENDNIFMIYMETHEINTVITFGKTEADKPVIFSA
jgi:predicted ATP-grasp superfamily ATP-dependent carboligase